MSLSVRHLNADSTFLLIFSPELHPKPADLTSANGAFSVLVDPWVTGSSIVNASWFAITNRVEPSAIQHLSELEEPDVVVVSQNKPDHCHKETLLQLRPEGRTIIAAEPGAAKAIKSWNHFDPVRVHGLSKYDPKAKFGNNFRVYIPPLSPDGLPGELCISFIPAKNYMTGLHNAFGITYQAPTRAKTLAAVATIDLPKTKYFHLPLSPSTASPTSPPPLVSPSWPQNVYSDSHTLDQSVNEKFSPAKRGHRPNLSRSSNTASSELLSIHAQPSIRPSQESLEDSTGSVFKAFAYVDFANEPTEEPFTVRYSLPTPPDSPSVSGAIPTFVSPHKASISSLSAGSNCNSRPLSTSNRPPTLHPPRPKAISILYTPHGITLSDLKPYVQNHLVRLPGALPLGLLLHSFDYTQNPWFLGGNIMTGAVGGMDIARALMARCWISAHDEDKDDRGVAVKLLKTERMDAEAIRKALLASDDDRSHGWVCDVRTLSVGKEITLSGNARDLCTGINNLKSAENVSASTLLKLAAQPAG